MGRSLPGVVVGDDNSMRNRDVIEQRRDRIETDFLNYDYNEMFKLVTDDLSKYLGYVYI